MEKEILFMEPVLKEMIWGGDRLKEEFDYSKATDKTGEAWAVSAHPNGDCVIKNGTWKGQTLSCLWESHRELFGNLQGDKFPLLVKIIDAKDDLSIQVHPDDSYAMEHENGSFGKTECWYILDCEENGTIVMGHNAKTKDELCQMIDNKKWNELIRTIPIKKGDFLQIDPGTVHAIKGGTLILETQQNSDITYRVYDYDRLSNGKPRELHVEKSKEVIKVPYEDKKQENGQKEEGQVEILITCSYYTVLKFTIQQKEEYVQNKAFQIMSVIDGEGTIDGISVKKGEHFIIPWGYGTYTLDGNMTLIGSFV